MNGALAVTLTVDELEALVARAVRSVSTSQEAEVMTREQVADMLKVTDRTVVSYVEKGGLPGHKIGPNAWRFLRSEVVAWMKKERK